MRIIFIMMNVNITIIGKLENEELAAKVYEAANKFKKDIGELISNPSASVLITEENNADIILD